MISTRVHGVIDYLAAAVLGGLSTNPSFGAATRRTLLIAGAYHAGYSAMTNYEYGVVPLVPLRLHRALDIAGATALCGAGLFLHRERALERTLLIGAGVAELAVIALTDFGRDASSEAASEIAVYEPVDQLKLVAPDVWIVDSGPLSILGAPVPLRMTAIRLPSDDILLYSPTRLTSDLSRQLDEIGKVRYLVAPNMAHWLYLKEWQEAYPATVTMAPPGLRQRRQIRKAGVQIDREVEDTAPDEWQDAIEIVAIPGGVGFREIALFHKATRTLLLSDIVQNFEARKLTAAMRMFARLVGSLGPDGRAPIYLRALVRLRGQEAAAAARRLLDLRPERVIFAHGAWFDRDGTASLTRSLSWLR